MAKARPTFRSGEDAVASWREHVLTGQADPLYPIGEGDLARFPIGPGRVTLIGGPPGAGKTAFTMQAAVDAARLTEDVKVCVCNVEMAPSVLLDRQLARLSGIDLTTISRRRIGSAHAARIETGIATLESIAERLCFVLSPFGLESVAAAADEFGANVLLLDYIQRIRPPGDQKDKRGSVDASMDFLRQFANEGQMAVIVVAAVARTKDSKGRSSYDAAGLTLASYRESSELEFGADDAFIITPPDLGGLSVLKHLKARHGEPGDIELRFDAPRQRFSAISRSKAGGVEGDAAAAWKQAGAAREEVP